MSRLNGEQIKILLFPNNEVKISEFRHLIRVDGDNVFEFQFRDNTSLLVLLIVAEILLELGAKCRLKIDYMPYSRMDHDIEGDIQTLPYICRMINRYDCFTEVTVVEPHSDRTLELLDKSKAFFPVPTWLSEIKAQIGFNEETDHIVFPDKNAAKRYENYGFKNVIVFDKERDTSDEGKGRIIRFSNLIAKNRVKI